MGCRLVQTRSYCVGGGSGFHWSSFSPCEANHCSFRGSIRFAVDRIGEGDNSLARSKRYWSVGVVGW